MDTLYRNFNKQYTPIVAQNCLTDSSSNTNFLDEVFLTSETAETSSTVNTKSLGHIPLPCPTRTERVMVMAHTPSYNKSAYTQGALTDHIINELTRNLTLTLENNSTSTYEKETDTRLIIEQLINEIDSPYKKDLYERLLFLDSPNDDPEDSPMLTGSLKHLFNFIKAHNPKYPDLFLTHDGILRSEWYRDNEHYFFAEFLPSGFVRYSSGIKSKKDSSQTERNQGRVSIDKLLPLIKATNAEHWCIDG